MRANKNGGNMQAVSLCLGGFEEDILYSPLLLPMSLPNLYMTNWEQVNDIQC